MTLSLRATEHRWQQWQTGTHFVADAQRNLRNLDVDEGVVHSCSLLHLVNVVHRMLVEGRWRDLKQQRRQPLFLTLSYKIVPCCHKIHLYVCLTSTSGGFLKDRLTPAVRFSPWATPLLGPMAPMVSSDCRVLTGIPETQDREKVLGFIVIYHSQEKLWLHKVIICISRSLSHSLTDAGLLCVFIIS